MSIQKLSKLLGLVMVLSMVLAACGTPAAATTEAPAEATSALLKFSPVTNWMLAAVIMVARSFRSKPLIV